MKAELQEPRSLRRRILLSYAIIAAVIGIPMWLWTTSIYRAPLNLELMNYYDKNIKSEIDIRVPIYFNVGHEFPDLAMATQLKVNEALRDAEVSGWSLDIRSGRGAATDYVVNFDQGSEGSFYISETSREIRIEYPLEFLSTTALPKLVADVLLHNVFKEEIDKVKSSTFSSKVVAFSPLYHLTFSIFKGDGIPISWDITEALEAHFSPLRTSLSRVANFTVDTQVQYYSKLSFELPEKTNGEYVLDKERLSTFVNFAEWSLTSIHSYPTLNFILYIPSEDQSPMRVTDSVSNSFIIPQWGGVIIKDPPASGKLSSADLLPVLEAFSAELLELLGAPSQPNSPLIRIDMLSRISSIRALLGASSTLGSLYRLSESLPNIAIPSPVKKAVDDAFVAIQDSVKALKRADGKTAVVRAGMALTLSEKAFFDRMMVQQMYFPDEHKVAIYLPLFVPMGIVLLTGLLRTIKEYKEDRKAQIKQD